MGKLLKTLQFLYQHQFQKYSSIEILHLKEDDQLPGNTLVFYPKKNNNYINRKVILLVHGMSPYGNTDPRYISLCKALAGCGYTIISPLFESIRDLKIELSSIDKIRSSIISITGNNEICPEGKLSIFTNSFSGSMCLIASTDPSVADRVKSICMIGSYSNIESSIGFLFKNQDSDPYGRLIVLNNFLKYSIDVSAPVKNAIETGIKDNFFAREGMAPELPALLEKMSLTDYDIAYRLLNCPEFRMYHWERIKNNPEISKMIIDFSVQKYLDKIKSSIIIIHGTDDIVIPPEESKRLYKELREHNINAKLLLTPLLGHSKLRFNPELLPSVFDLFNGLSFFFKVA